MQTKIKTNKKKRLPKRHTLKKEIAIVLVVKLIFIIAIWKLFFSEPQAKHVNDETMVNRLVN